jgi:hypothetical protein
MKQKNEDKMLTELSHYLTSSFTKGSKEEIAELIAKLENPNREKEDKIKKKILNQRYIIYDFETDTHTDIHRLLQLVSASQKVSRCMDLLST